MHWTGVDVRPRIGARAPSCFATAAEALPHAVED
jgi:hypothetical protein